MQGRKKRNPLFRLLILVVLIGGLSFFGYRGYLNYLKTPLNSNSEVKAFVVIEGDGASIIAEKLENDKFIRSAFAFRQAFKESGLDVKINAGTFKIASSMSVDEIIKTLTDQPVDKWVTLLEGWRVEQIAEQLNRELGMDKSEFLKHAKEGYMFPDTYLFNREVAPSDIASTLENTFKKRYSDDLQNKIKLKGLTAEQGVVLASLVEREARSDEVRTQVAGIILKRLKMGMKLDIDATVRYAKDTEILKSGKMPKPFWAAILQTDYSSVKSPFNTYLNNGLPPEPICNPSLSSLKAVANADSSTPYLFYYHDTKGNSYYARTLDEHNSNVANHR